MKISRENFHSDFQKIKACLLVRLGKLKLNCSLEYVSMSQEQYQIKSIIISEEKSVKNIKKSYSVQFKENSGFIILL